MFVTFDYPELYRRHYDTRGFHLNDSGSKQLRCISFSVFFEIIIIYFINFIYFLSVSIINQLIALRSNQTAELQVPTDTLNS